MKVNFSDLELAFYFASLDSFGENNAYLCRVTGRIYYDSDASEDELPADIYVNDSYLEIPDQRDLDLGRFLVYRFVEESMPSDLNAIYSIFRKKGAYSRYKAFLEKRSKLEEWYRYEDSKKRKELLSWCDNNNIEVNLTK